MKRASLYARLDEKTVERLDALAEEMTKAAHGEEQNRSDAMRVAIRRGLDAIDADRAKKTR